MDKIYLNILSSSLEYIILNIKDKNVLISEKLAETIGYDGEEYIKYKYFYKKYVYPGDIDKAKIKLDKINSFIVLESPVKYRLRISNGKYEWFQSERTIIKDDYNNPLKIVEIYQNINNTVNYYMEREKAKTDLMNYICHEFKTPLNIILGVIQLIELRDKNSKETGFDYISKNKLHKYIKYMKQNTYRLIRLINNMLDLSKINNNYLLLDLENENIVKIVEDIVLSVSEVTKDKNLKLIFNSEIEEKFIACDKDKIEKVILNLLSNAIKYTDPGGYIKINIWEEEGKVYILVEDSGIGIPYDAQKSIFDIYKQVNFRNKREKQGSGIGLSLVKSILELHGGKIWVESEVNKGSKFYIELPDKTIDNKYIKEKIEENYNEMVEKIHIEFSDIYSN